MVQVMDHHVCQSPHLWWKRDCIHGWLLWCSTKNFHHVHSRSQSIFILDWDRLRRRKNLQIFLNAIPCNHKFLMSHLALYTISIHNIIGEKLLYNLWIDNPNRVQQFGPSSFFEHLKDESAFKWFQLHDPFHDDRFILIAVIVLHIGFSRLEMIRISVCTFGRGFLGGCMFSRSHLCKGTQTKKNQVRTHKTEHKTWLDSS